MQLKEHKDSEEIYSDNVYEDCINGCLDPYVLCANREDALRVDKAACVIREFITSILAQRSDILF